MNPVLLVAIGAGWLLMATVAWWISVSWDGKITMAHIICLGPLCILLAPLLFAILGGIALSERLDKHVLYTRAPKKKTRKK